MKIIFLFPGYGTQFVGMCKELYDSSRLVQEFFEEASNCLDINFVKQCFASSDTDLAAMVYAYPAIFLAGVSICALLFQMGIRPDAVAGYDIGQYSALFAARSLNVPDGLYLLHKLSMLYESCLDKNAYKLMRVQGLSSRELMKIITEVADDTVSISHYISEYEHILSGRSINIEQVEPLMKAAKGKIKYLPLAYGIHTSLAQEVAEKFALSMAKVDFNDLEVPLLSCLDGRNMTKGSSIRDRTVRLLTLPIKWSSVTKQLGEYDVIIEIGQPSAYLDEVRGRFPQCTFLSVSRPQDVELVQKICQPSPESVDEEDSTYEPGNY